MPKLKDIDVSYDQIRDLVEQLDFEKKMDLLRNLLKGKKYKDSFYNYTENLAKKYKIPKMTEEELDLFLHEEIKGN